MRVLLIKRTPAFKAVVALMVALAAAWTRAENLEEEGPRSDLAPRAADPGHPK